METKNNILYCNDTYEIYKSYTDMVIKEINIIKKSYLKIFKELTKEQKVDAIIDQLRSKEALKKGLITISNTYENGIFFKLHVGDKTLPNSATFLFKEDEKSNFILSYIGINFDFKNTLDILYEMEKDYCKFQITDQENGFRMTILDSDKNDPMYFTTVPDKISHSLPNIEFYIPVYYHNKNKDSPYNNIFLQDKNQLNLNITLFAPELIDIHLMTYDYDLSKYSNIFLDLKLLQTHYDIFKENLKKENRYVT